jgi:hypothetical protein
LLRLRTEAKVIAGGIHEGVQITLDGRSAFSARPPPTFSRSSETGFHLSSEAEFQQKQQETKEMTTLNLPYRIGDQVKATAGKYNGDSGVVTRMTAMEVEVVLEREQKTALC